MRRLQKTARDFAERRLTVDAAAQVVGKPADAERPWSFCTWRGITASRRPQTATYSEGPGVRASARHQAKPTCSTKRSASSGVVTCFALSRHQRESRISSMSDGISGWGMRADRSYRDVFAVKLTP
jgi:hypothetical protein